VSIVVVHLGERARIEFPGHDGVSELADVPALLPGQAGAAQGRLVEPGDGLRCHGARDPLEAPVRRSAGRERHLLLEDDLDQGLEAWRPIPEGRRPMTGDDRGEMRVAPRQLGNTVSEHRRCELNRYISQTRGPTLL
jgi:hypothetical protein